MAKVLRVSEGFKLYDGYSDIIEGGFDIWIDFGEGDAHDILDEIPMRIVYDKSLKTLSFRNVYEDDQFIPFSKIVEFRELLQSKGYEVI